MDIQSITSFLEPVSDELRSISSHDPNDSFLVNQISFEPDETAQFTHVMIGCPQDEGVSRNNGRPGSAKAPNAIRRQLYKLQMPESDHLHLLDAGNVIFQSLEESHYRLQMAVTHFLKNGCKVVVLGGGNDISFADVSAFTAVFDNCIAINMDAHLDMRIQDVMTSGTPYRKLIEEKKLKPENLYQFGIRPESNAPGYLMQAAEMGVRIILRSEVEHAGALPSFKKITENIDGRPLFLGLDMDSIQMSDAPGVSAPFPSGFTAREMLDCVEYAAQSNNLKLFEITEMNPDLDIDSGTARLAALAVYRFLRPSGRF